MLEDDEDQNDQYEEGFNDWSATFPTMVTGPNVNCFQFFNSAAAVKPDKAEHAKEHDQNKPKEKVRIEGVWEATFC